MADAFIAALTAAAPVVYQVSGVDILWVFAAVYLSTNLALLAKLAAVVWLLIMVRVTVPRLKLESVSRLGWAAAFALLAFAVVAACVVVFVA